MRVYHDGSHWIAITDDGTSTHATASGQYPPKTGWPNIGGKSFSLSYEMLGIDDNGALEEISYADYLAHVSLTENTLLRWKDIDGVCHVEADVRYKQGSFENMNPSDYSKVPDYYGDDCGAGHLVPFEVTSGGVGTDGTWYTEDGTTIGLMVEDA